LGWMFRLPRLSTSISWLLAGWSSFSLL